MSKYKFLVLGFAIWAMAGVASAATFTVSPSSGTYSSGGTFTVNVVLDTTGASIDGVDVRYLRFNPNVLQVVDSNASVTGVQVTPGTLMPSTLTNIVDNSAGTITFSQIVVGGQHYSGSGTLFTITFQAVSGGTGTISFDATPGRTTDSNVASNGADVLSTASGASYSISGAVVPTPAPTPTPTPSSGSGGSSSPSPSPSATPTPTSSGSSSGSTPTPNPVISGNNNVPPPILSRSLYLGMSGTDVTSLQNYLIATGYLSSGNNSGYFGQLTRAAVQRFQCDKGLACSGDEGTTGYGLVGSRTRLAFSGGGMATGTTTPVTPTPTSTTGKVILTRTVYVGSKGSDITALQNFLIAKGYLSAGNNTGFFGQLTRAAVRKFQCDKGLACSGDESSTGYGLVGARTRAAIAASN